MTGFKMTVRQDQVRSGWYGPRQLINEYLPHSSTLAWKIPWMEEPGLLISHRVPWVKTPPGPGLLMSALARAVHSRVRRAPGSSGGCSPWGWPQPCDTVPAQWLQLPQRREERRPARKDQQRLLPWPLGNSPGKTLGNITWAKFPTSVFF